MDIPRGGGEGAGPLTAAASSAAYFSRRRSFSESMGLKADDEAGGGGLSGGVTDGRKLLPFALSSELLDLCVGIVC